MEASVCWTATLLSLWGVVLNVRKDSRCFLLWSLTNATWCIVDFRHALYSQSLLQFVFFCLSVWGLVVWRRKERTDGRTATQ